MRKRHILWPLSLCLFSGFLHAACLNAKPAQRIISLAPDITETLFAIGAGKQVVGVIQGSDYPLDAKQITLVGSYSGIDLEKIVALRPDLIVVWGQSFARQIDVLKKLGVQVYVTNPRDLQDVPQTMRALGCLTAHTKEAEQKAQLFSQQINQLRRHYENQKPIRVFYQLGDYGLMTINKTSWINQVITLCGGKNVFASAHFNAPEVTWEAVLTANPQVVISDANQPDWQQRWKKWQDIAAVKHNHLYTINPDLIDRASPRLAQGAKIFCEDIDGVRKTKATV